MFCPGIGPNDIGKARSDTVYMIEESLEICIKMENNGKNIFISLKLTSVCRKHIISWEDKKMVPLLEIPFSQPVDPKVDKLVSRQE